MHVVVAWQKSPKGEQEPYDINETLPVKHEFKHQSTGPQQITLRTIRLLSATVFWGEAQCACCYCAFSRASFVDALIVISK